MALPFEPMHRKFKLVDGSTVSNHKPSYDDWDHMDASLIETYEAGSSLEAGLSGRAVSLASLGPSGENHLRQYHVDESNDKKREKLQDMMSKVSATTVCNRYGLAGFSARKGNFFPHSLTAVRTHA